MRYDPEGGDLNVAEPILAPYPKVVLQTAALECSQSPYSWQHWEFEWKAPKPGYFMVRSRATDTRGNVQPERAEWNFRGFGNNSIPAVPVTIRD